MKDARSVLIVALDVPDKATAWSMIDRLSGHVGFFKIGFQLFVKEGPELVRSLVERGERVFLDLKLHDIPNTVGRAVQSASQLGIHMLTIHAAGGRPMIESALEAATASRVPLTLVGVTALTSLSEPELREIGIEGTVADWVAKLAEVAVGSGLSALVASTHECPTLRRRYGKDLTLVVPGIRPKRMQDDQSRIATPADAVRQGADYLVVGRPILQARDPRAAADSIVGELGPIDR